MATQKEPQNRNYSARGMEIAERVVSINRVSKVVKGGKRFRFSVLVVVGDGIDQVGVGMGKAREISDAVRKGIDHAKKNMIDLKKNGGTIPHPVQGKFGAAEVLIRPAAPGTGVIAGAVVRAIMELGGVKDVVTKVIGRTSNPINVAYATFEAVHGLRTAEEVRRLRGRGSPVSV